MISGAKIKLTKKTKYEMKNDFGRKFSRKIWGASRN